MTGFVFDIKEFGIHDGPGLRTTVFLKGCPLRCVWCHNPEGLSREPQLYYRKSACKNCGLCRRQCDHPDCKPFGRCLHICPDGLLKAVGEEIEADALAKRIMRNYDLIKDGGVTFSGGEPLMQADFMLDVISHLDNLPVAIETSGYAHPDTFVKVVQKVDLVYMDLKLADDGMHKKYTGVSNKRILENLEYLKKCGKKCVIRTPLIPNITDSEQNIEKIKELVCPLEHELLPYNTMAGVKYEFFDMEFAYAKQI